uniref:Domain of unknown function DB domain-containing protein n=1 Tax=Parascaris univalens TaxID=6257 RepID=A0A915B3C5_PARUN
MPSLSPTCQPGCGPGYQCGPYGCARRRARVLSSNTFTEVKAESQKSKLMKMFTKQDACPIQASVEIQFCAAQGRDHRECCARNGVTTTLAGEKCLLFCDQRPGNVTQLDITYVSCYDRFENMKGCFWHDLAARIDRNL